MLTSRFDTSAWRKPLSPRFAPAFLAAAAAATVGITLAALADGLASGSPAGGPGDLLFSVAIYFACSLAFTFVLGLPGWALLRLFGCTTYLAYALVGTGLGALAGGWLIEFTPANPLLFVFGLAGLLAALAFRWVYGDDRRAASAA